MHFFQKVKYKIWSRSQGNLIVDGNIYIYGLYTFFKFKLKSGDLIQQQFQLQSIAPYLPY